MFMVICYIFPKWPSKFLTILYIKTGINLEIFCCKNIIIESFPFYFSNNYCENWKYLEFNLFICKTSWTVLKSTVSFYYNFLLYSYNGSLKTGTGVLSGVHSEQERFNTSFGNYVSIIQVIGANFRRSTRMKKFSEAVIKALKPEKISRIFLECIESLKNHGKIKKK